MTSAARFLLLLTRTANAITYLLRDEFTTAIAAPIPRDCEPGPGQLVVVQNDGQFSISGGLLAFPAQATPAFVDQALYELNGRARVVGRCLVQQGKFSTYGAACLLVGWTKAPNANWGSYANVAIGFDTGSSGNLFAVYYPNSGIAVGGTLATATDYIFASVLRSTGGFLFIKGGAFASWTLLWISDLDNTATIYPTFSNYNAAGTLDYFRVRDLPAPFTTDYGIATLNIASPVNGNLSTGEADAIIDMTLVAANPVSSNGGFRFRVQDASNYWYIYFDTSGNLKVDSVASGTPTNRLTVAGVILNGQTRTARVICSGTLIDCYTLNGTTWTKQGSQINNSAFQSATGIQPDFGVDWTVSNLRDYPRTSSNYALLDATGGELLDDEFTTDAAAGQVVTHKAEPGPGTLVFVQNDGQFSISGGKLNVPAQATPVYGDLGFYSNALARVVGRALIQELTHSVANNNHRIPSWFNAASIATGGMLYNFALGTAVFQSGGTAFGSVALSAAGTVNGTSYQIALVLRSTGAFGFIKGGAFTNWTLLWLTAIDNTATVYAGISNYDTVGTSDFIRIRDLPAPFTTDLGIAENNITSFTQSAGAELLTNPGFANWTGDNPDGWTVTGEVGSDPMVTQVAPGGGAGSGAARMFASGAISDPVIYQTPLNAGSWYEASINMTARVSGSFNYQEPGGAQIASAAVGIHRMIFKAIGTQIRVQSNAVAHDYTIDDASIKLLTLNAVATMNANSIVDFAFTLPVSPVAGQTIQLRYRVQDDQNYWVAYLKRGDTNSNWDFFVDSVAAGVATNRIGVNAVGPATTIRVICDGNLHDAYTLTGTTWTKQGAQINNAALNTATGLTTVYSTGTTPTSLISYPRSQAAYNALG